MEIIAKPQRSSNETVTKRNRNRQRAQKATEVDVIVKPSSKPVTIPSQVNSAASSRRRRNKPRRSALGSSDLMQGRKGNFVKALLYPDLVGPIRVPIIGAAPKTVLGMDRAEATLPGSTNALNYHQYVLMQTDYTNSYRVSTGFAAAAAIPTGTVKVPDLQFPSNVQISSCILTSACVTISYIGPVLNATGSVTVGWLSNLYGVTLGTTTLAMVKFHPSFFEIPISEVIKEGIIRFSIEPSDVGANDFVSSGGLQGDRQIPIIITSGMTDVNGSLRVNIVRNWMVTSQEASAGSLPYEVVGPSFTADINAFQDAVAAIANRPQSLVSTGWNFLKKNLTAANIARGARFGISVANMLSGVGIHQSLATAHLSMCQSLHPGLSVSFPSNEKALRELEEKKEPNPKEEVDDLHNYTSLANELERVIRDSPSLSLKKSNSSKLDSRESR